jgi:hypothetical protein
MVLEALSPWTLLARLLRVLSAAVELRRGEGEEGLRRAGFRSTSCTCSASFGWVAWFAWLGGMPGGAERDILLPWTFLIVVSAFVVIGCM